MIDSNTILSAIGASKKALTKQSFAVVCRGSWLSVAQAEIFKQKVALHFPSVNINIVIKETAGDKNQSTPLHLVEGKDFFTKDIQDFLQSGQADFAIHSMKDVSGEAFFNQNYYAIIDREDIRDVAIFNANIIDKLKNSQPIIIGTSSPRRSNMATHFLQQALPQFNATLPNIKAIPIRGNVDVRLHKLETEEMYDGIILAAAGLNRLLQYAPAKKAVAAFLANKKWMYLPLFECPPATGQGAIVVETVANNVDAITILNTIKDTVNHNAIQQERHMAAKYGYGCSQQFGTFHVDLPTISFTYAAGLNANATTFTEWKCTTMELCLQEKIVASSNYMKEFFSYQFDTSIQIPTTCTSVFIASHKAIHSNDSVKQLYQKNIWVAGTKTWLALAKKGLWVNGSSDGLGIDFIDKTWASALVSIVPKDVCIITNTESAANWQQNGRIAIGTYTLHPALSRHLQTEIETADHIFWTSYQQYQLCKSFLKLTVHHYCLPGQTAILLQQQGIQPIIFPSIKAFNIWMKKNTLTNNEE